MTMAKHGIFIYTGDAANFHELEFRTSLRMFGAQSTEERSRAGSNILDGLRGDALKVAQEVGSMSLAAPACITTLISRMTR